MALSIGSRLGAVVGAGALAASSLVYFSATPVAVALDPVGFWDCSGIDCPPGAYPAVGNGAITDHDDSVNVFVGGDMTVTGAAAESEGLTVVLGDFALAKTSGSNRYDIGEAGVGSRIVPNPGEDFFAVGGNVTVSPTYQAVVGASQPSVARVAGTITGDLNTGTSAPPIIDAAAVAPYANAPAALAATSNCLAGLAATGTAVFQFGALSLTGTNNPDLEIFNFSGNLGTATGNSGITFSNINPDATVIVNMLGGGTKFVRTYTGGGGGLPDTIRENLLWNFPEADDIQMLGVAQWQGSVLIANPASNAIVQYPGINGRFYTLGNVTHQGQGAEFHNYPFNGNLDAVCAAPPADPTYDLALQKTINSVSGPLLDDAGNGSVTFDLTVTNQDSAVQQIEITDYLGVGADIDFTYDPLDQPGVAVSGSDGDTFTVAWDATNPVVTLTAASAADELALGETVTVPITLDVSPTYDVATDSSFDNAAEISAFDNDLDGGNADPTDSDSTPDGTDQSNDGETVGANLVDDEISEANSSGGDEDDHDIASIRWWDLALINTRNASTNYVLDTGGPTTTATFDIVVKNQAINTAFNVEVLDQLPPGTSFVSNDAVVPGVTFNAATATTASWTISALEPGQEVTLTFTVEITDDTLVSYENTAEITEFSDDFGVANTAPGGPFDIDSTPDLDPTNDQFFEDVTNADNPRNSHNLIDYDADGDGNINEPATDPTTGDEDDHGREVVILPGSFDQALTKTVTGASASPVVVGTEITWDVTVTNQGDPIQTLQVTDYPTYDDTDQAATLIAGAATATDGTDTYDLTWNVAATPPTVDIVAQGAGTLDTGESITIEFTTVVAPTWDGSSIVNWSEIASFDNDKDPANGDSSAAGTGQLLVDQDSTPDTTPGNDNQPDEAGDPTDDEIDQDGKNGATGNDDEDDHDVAELPIYDLSLIDTRAPGQNFLISTGDTTVEFSLTVKNQGDERANNIDVANYVPTGTTFSPANNAANNAAAPKVTYNADGSFTIDTLAPGQEVTFDVLYDITTAQPEYINGAEISGFDGDPGVDPALVVDIDSDPDAIDTDTIDETVAINADDVRNSHNDIDFDRDDPAGANTPIVTPTDEDDHDREVVIVQEVYDLALAKTVTTAPATLADGENIVWTATVTNQGDPVQVIEITDYPNYDPTDATNTDELAAILTAGAPATLTDDGVGPAATTFDVAYSGNTIRLVAQGAGALAIGESIQIPITTEIAATWDGSDIANWAEINLFDNDKDAANGDSSAAGTGEQLVDIDSTPDTTPGNDDQPDEAGDPTDDEIDQDGKNGATGNDDEDDHDVAAIAVYDLALIKTLAAGQTPSVNKTATDISFTITVKNQGPNATQNIDVTDTIPGDVTYDPASAANTANDDAAPKVTYNPGGTFQIDSLVAGEVVTFDVNFEITDPPNNTAVEFVNAAEISRFENADGVGNDQPSGPVDIDSTPSATDSDIISSAPTGDVRNSHNDIDNDRDVDGNPFLPALPDEDDHDREVVTRVQFDLALTKTLDFANVPDPVVPGSVIPWTIVVTNQGDLVQSITVVDYPRYDSATNFTSGMLAGPATIEANGVTFAASWEFLGADTPRVVLTAPAGEGLDLGESIVIPISTTVAAGWDGSSTLTNWAEIEAFDDDTAVAGNSETGDLVDVDSTPDIDATNDPNQPVAFGPNDDFIDGDAKTNASDDEDDHDIASLPFYDLSLIKTRSTGQPFNVSGDSLSVDFDITVKNQGSGQVFFINVVDYIPAGMSFDLAANAANDAAAPRVTYNADGTFQIDTLAPFVPAAGPVAAIAGESLTFTVSLDITNSSLAEFVNGAEISGFDIDDDDTNAPSPLAVDVDSTPDNDNEGGAADVIDETTANADDQRNSHNDIDNDRTNPTTTNTPSVPANADEDDHDREVVVLPFDLALRKTLDGAPPAVIAQNTPIDFVITVFNQGRDVAEIDIADYLGANFRFVAADNTAGTATSAAGASITYAWPVADVASSDTAAAQLVGPLAAGDSVAIPITLTVDVAAPDSQLENFAEISRFDDDNDDVNGDSSAGPNQLVDIDSTPDDVDQSNDGETLGAELVDDEITGDRTGTGTEDEDDHDVAATRWFDLALIKVRSAGQDYVLDPTSGTVAVNFDITVTNQGPDTNTLIDIIDYAPLGMIYGDNAANAAAAAGDGVTYNGDGTFQIASLAAGAPNPSVTFTVTYDVAINANTPDRFVNEAEITQMIGMFDADGNGTLEDVPVSDIDSTPDGVQGNDAFDPTGVIDPDDGPNVADVNTPDQNAINLLDEDDADSEAFTMPADLALRKTFESINTERVVPGGKVQFEIEIFNQGLAPLDTIEVTDYFDAAQFEFILSDNPPATSGPSNGDAWLLAGGQAFTSPATALDYSWTAGAVATLTGTLAPGESVTLPVILTTTATANADLLFNTAEISDYDDDSNPGTPRPIETDSTPDSTNESDAGETVGGDLIDDEIDERGDVDGDDEDDHDIAAIPIYDLSLINTLAPGQTFTIAADAEKVNFDITVKNQGDETAFLIDVVDYMPAGTTFDSLGAQSGDGTVTLGAPGVPGTNTQFFQIDELASGESVTFTVMLEITDTSVGEYLNKAEIAAFDGDNIAGNPALDGVVDIDSVPDAIDGDNVDTSANIDPNGNDDRNSHNMIDNDRLDPDGANTPIPTPSDEDDHGQELVVMEFDLALRKTLAGPPPAVVQNGTKIDFVVTVLNQGRDVAQIDLVDYIGPNFTYLPADNTASSATSDDGATIAFAWPTAAAPAGSTVLGVITSALAAGDTVDIPITLTAVINDATEQLINWAEISRFDSDADPANGDSSVPGTGVQLVDVDSTPDSTDGNGPGEGADVVDNDVDGDAKGTPGDDEDDHDLAEVRWFDLSLIIERSATQDYVVDPLDAIGGELMVNWDITVSNQGVNDNFDIEVIDRLPLGLTYDSFVGVVAGTAAVTEGTDGPGTQSFEIPVLTAGDSVTFTILTKVALTPTTPTRFVNDAEIAGMAGQFDTDGDGVVQPLPVPVSDIDSTPDTAVGDVFDAGDPTDAGDIANGVLDPDDGHNDPAVDSAADGINNFDGDDEDDADTEAIVMLGDLALIKSFDDIAAAPLLPNGKVRFQIEVLNQGLTTVNVVEVTDYVQTGFVFDIADNGPGAAAASTGLDWELVGQPFASPATPVSYVWDDTDPLLPTVVLSGDVAPGESVVVPVVLTVGPGAAVGTLVNKAEISDFDVDGDLTGDNPGDTDSTPDNTDDDVQPATPGEPTDDEIDGRAGGTPDDEDDHDIAGIPVYDVSLIIDRSPTQTYVIDPADQVRWDVTVRNQGTEDIQNVLVNVEQMLGSLTTVGADTDAGLPTGFPPGPSIAVTRIGEDYLIDALEVSEEITFTIVTTILTVGVDGRVVQKAEVESFADADGVSSADPGGPIDVDSSPDGDINDDPLLENVAGTADVVDSHNDILYDPDDDLNVNELTPGDEDDHDAAAVVTGFDLALVKEIDTLATPAVLERGDDIAYTITVINQGVRPVEEIDVTDSFDPTLFAAFDPAKNLPGTALDDTSGDTIAYSYVDNGAGSVIIELSGASLDPDESVTVPLVLTASPTLAAQTVLENIAEISRFDDDDDPSNGDSDDTDPGSEFRDSDSEANDDPTDDGEPIDNVTSGELGGDPDDEDDHDPASVTVQVFDLALRKTVVDVSPMPAQPGVSKVTYEIEVINQGTINATDILITDYIQPGTTFLAADNQATPQRNTTWAGADGATSVTTEIAQIFSDRSITVDIVLLVELVPEDVLTRVNFAEISAADDNGDPGDTPPTDIDSTPDDVNDEVAAGYEDDEVSEDALTPGPDTSGDGTIDEDDHDGAEIELPVFDLALRKTINPTATNVLAPGGDVTFAIEVFNQGELAANDITVVDYLPVGMTLSPVDANGWTGTGQTVTTVIAGPLAPGASATVDIVARLGDLTGELVNAAEIVRAEDENDAERRDVDSTPNDDPTDDDNPIDNETENGDGDEDDHDIESITIEPSSLGDKVWLDANRDGIQDPDEPGIAGVTVELLDASGEAIDETTTDAAGIYGFENLVPVTYSVRFDLSTLPNGHTVTTPDAGDNDAADSDGNPVTGETGTTALDPGENDPTLDLGVLPPSFDLQAIKVPLDIDIPGRIVSWRVEARNVGEGRALGPITIIDTLPPVLSLVEVRNLSVPGNCTVDGQVVTCVFNADIEPGGSITANVITRVAPNSPMISNEIRVLSSLGLQSESGTSENDTLASIPFDTVLPATGSTIGQLLRLAAIAVGIGLALWFATRTRRRRPITLG